MLLELPIPKAEVMPLGQGSLISTIKEQLQIYYTEMH